jgi:hypothetical protein
MTMGTSHGGCLLVFYKTGIGCASYKDFSVLVVILSALVVTLNALTWHNRGLRKHQHQTQARTGIGVQATANCRAAVTSTKLNSPPGSRASKKRPAFIYVSLGYR